MAAKRTAAKPHEFDIARATGIVAYHYDSGVWPSLQRATVEQVTKFGYDVLHGTLMSREDRIDLLGALAVLERAGNYQPKG
jgi:N-glycosylase/DNA lyase